MLLDDMLDQDKPQVVDCYDLLTREQREQIADIMMEAMSFHDIYPEIWEMKVEAIIESETDRNDIQ
tara:strand:- start:2514 stop:2711 length:198 start_codon:yes stop_codon:yes gene_type:complete